MEAIKIGIREFRDKLSMYLLDTDAPVAITRHGDTVGYYIPARRRRNDTERAALQEASARWQQVLSAEGITEEDAMKEFRHWRKNRRRPALKGRGFSRAVKPNKDAGFSP